MSTTRSRVPRFVLLAAFLLAAGDARAATIVIDPNAFAVGTDVSTAIAGVTLAVELGGALDPRQPPGIGDLGDGNGLGLIWPVDDPQPWFELTNTFLTLTYSLRIVVDAPVERIAVHTRSVHQDGFPVTGLHQLDAVGPGTSFVRDEIEVAPGDPGGLLELTDVAAADFFRFRVDLRSPNTGRMNAWIERIEIETVPEPAVTALVLLVVFASGWCCAARSRSAAPLPGPAA